MVELVVSDTLVYFLLWARTVKELLYTYMSIHLYIYIYIYIYIYVCVCVCMYVYINIYTYIWLSRRRAGRLWNALLPILGPQGERTIIYMYVYPSIYIYIHT